jgi:type I restriction-modification system DNA methylase subunit
MVRPTNQQSVLDILENLNGLDPLKELFWNELNYERVNEPISRRDWIETAAKSLADDPVVFAGGGESNDFKIIVARLDSDRVQLGMQRPVINRLLRDFPYAFFVFSNRDRNSWHFVNVKYDAEPGRRQLFRRISVSPGDRLRTASERMAMLDLQAIGDQASPLAIQDRHDEAFDVEQVTKKFFDDFVEIFAAVAKDIRKHNDWEQDLVEKETQTLLNRLLFLYFIQRKGWLNRERDYLYRRFDAEFRKDRDDFTYYSRFLFPLFIRLSTEMEEPASFLGDVPFLNGGLFDDEYGGQQRQAKLLRRTRMKVSNRAFARVFDDVLEKYNFTVREDTPLNQDVSIDPEMLGKIFESLVLQLERTDTGGNTSRHDTGSYYTPRPIVHYLCREALRACLESKGEDRHRNIAKLLAIDASDGIDGDERAVLDECLSPEQSKALRDDLDNLRACDPAVGSGAFPLGLLHELVNLSRLCEARSRGRDPVEVDVDWLYDTKSKFIERVIYGVDIQERAVEICKLRLWLSLMVDLDIGVDVDDCSASAFRTALRRKVTPLPNLDYKIRRADSLIDRIHGQPLHIEAHADPHFHVILSRLNQAKQEFYRAKKLEQKRKWRFKIFDATAELGQHEIAWERNRVGELIADEKHATRLSELDRAMRELGNMREQIRAANKLKAHQQDDALERFSKRFDDPEKPTFVWQLDFAEVFHRDDRNRSTRTDLLDATEYEIGQSGFDMMVANPPYIAVENIPPPLRTVYSDMYGENGKLGKRYDVYQLFVMKALRLLRTGGSLAFIMPNTFLMGHSYQLMRKRIHQSGAIIECVDLPQGVFEQMVDTVLLFLRVTADEKIRRRNSIRVKKLLPKSEVARVTSGDWDESFELPQSELTEASGYKLNIYANPKQRQLFEKLEKISVRLGDITESSQGIILYKTAADAARAQYTGTKPKVGWKKLLRGTNIGRYVTKWGGEYVKYGPWLWCARDEKFLANPKILLHAMRNKSLARRLVGTYDDEEFYNAHNLANIISKKGSPYDLRYILALFNSTLLNFWYKGHFPNVNINPNDFRQIPIRKINFADRGEKAEHDALVRLVTRMLSARRVDPVADLSDLDYEVDERVYRLYGLTAQERGIVSSEH